ncbi:WGR domain-containing protein [Methylosinus sp. H3A]|uniref:WGR domain-containing protein n=1 Tax=Methylosinus sp. H3A TaxID=2785786 RepID=UPI001FEF86A9|nr:WGR domain-containing protein [Methylosinus sp. H3A]
MAAMDEIAIALQGRNPDANRHRSWRVEAGRDLFGAWIVRISFGRIGCRGRTFAREFGSEDEARAYVRDGLRRRKGAVRRCGVEYRVVDASPAAQPLLTTVRLSNGAKPFEAPEPRLET